MTSEVAGSTVRQSTPATVERMAEAASALLASLQPAQRERAVYAFADEEERRRWYYTPTNQGGLTLSEMTATQQRLTHRLVASGLSAPGYVTASTIMGIENTLDAIEGWHNRAMPVYPGRPSHSRTRDPLMYFISVFGEPGGAGPWGWRFGGHHLSLHNTIVDGRIVSPMPTFFGSNPAEAAMVGPNLLRPLAGEEDLGRELLLSLDESQRAVAVLSPHAPTDIIQSNRPSVEDNVLQRENWEIFGFPMPPEEVEERRARNAERERRLGFSAAIAEALRYSHAPKGLAAGRMNAKQREVFMALIGQYVHRLPDEIAELEAAKLAGATFDAIHFGWAGGVKHREPHYYRLQGPRFLVEYDNVQDGANHIHSVWRDPDGDFGADLLAQHYAAAHGGAGDA